MTVPECATHIMENSQGFDPSWANSNATADFQKVLLKFQVMHENSFLDFISLPREKIESRKVCLVDRPASDGRLFCSEGDWDEVLFDLGMTQGTLESRCDVIIHMQSVAGFSGYETGPESSNPNRFHTENQAKEQDLLTHKIYKNHSGYTECPFSINFDEKLHRVADIILDRIPQANAAGR